MATGDSMFFCGSEDLNKDEKHKQLGREVADYNIHISDDHKQRIADKKEWDTKSGIEATRHVYELLDIEATEKKHKQEIYSRSVDDYEAEQKQGREQKVHDEEDKEADQRAWQRHHNEIRSEEKRVSDQLNKDQEDRETANFEANFDNVQNLQENETREYDDFIEKGMKKSDQRMVVEDAQEKHSNEHVDDEMSTFRYNQKAAGILHMKQCKNQCSCRKQSYPCGHPNHTEED